MKKRIFVSLFLTLMANIFCIPLWSECDYSDFIKTLFNKEARLDLVYRGKNTGAELFRFASNPNPSDTTWLYGVDDSRRAVLSWEAGREWQAVSLEFEAPNDGKLTVVLRGPSGLDEHGKAHSVLTDWRNLKINGSVVFTEPRTFSFEKGFVKLIPVKKNAMVKIDAEFRRHTFSFHDFTWTKSGKVLYVITGSIFFFFLICRALSIIAKFCGQHRLCDTLLVTVFFPLIFVPMIYVSDDQRCAQENRRLAVKPKFAEILKENANTGGGYEKWFADRFCGRSVLMQLHDVIRNKLSHIVKTKRGIYFKEGGCAFLLPLVSDMDCKSVSIQSIIQNLLEMNHFCQQNKIKFYVLEVPRKQSIHKEFLAEKYGFDERAYTKVSQAQEVIRNEARKHHIPYIYPYNALRDAAKRDNVFHKWTVHWTDLGAFIGYHELMKEIIKDFPDMPVVSLNDCRKSQNRRIRDGWHGSYHLGDIHWLFNFRDDPKNRTLNNYYDNRNADNMVVKVGTFTKDFSIPSGKHKIMLMGTSQNENLNRYLPYSAAQTKYIRVNSRPVKDSEQWKIIKLYKKDILSFKPDILILSICTDNLHRLRDLCSTK